MIEPMECAHGDNPQPTLDHDQTEERLLEALNLTRLAWQRAAHDNREAARLEFVNALQIYYTFMVDGKLLQP
jgi:agmatine/peptidylarginine deiminase